MKFPERSVGVKNLIKMEAGLSITGVFRGEPHQVWKHWLGNKPATCTGQATCEQCKSGNKANYRLQINFVTKENGIFVAKVFEGGARFQAQLEELNKDYPLEKHVVKITRTGKGTDTSYTVMPIPKSEVTPKLEAELSKVELNPLGAAAVAGAALAATATDGPEAEEGDTSFDVN